MERKKTTTAPWDFVCNDYSLCWLHPLMVSSRVNPVWWCGMSRELDCSRCLFPVVFTCMQRSQNGKLFVKMFRSFWQKVKLHSPSQKLRPGFVLVYLQIRLHLFWLTVFLPSSCYRCCYCCVRSIVSHVGSFILLCVYVCVSVCVSV